MNILVVNDDGIESPGLRLAVEAMKPYGTVCVVAPHEQQSAIGHGITIHTPIRLHHREDILPGIDSWSLEGKPADCVKFALYGLNLPVDLVVSGMNDGPNLGTDIIYSGTLAGASEAIICGIPALALSADFGGFDAAAAQLPELVERILKADILSAGRVINVNFPQREFSPARGIKIAGMGVRPFRHEFVEENGVYWSRGGWEPAQNGPETDVWAWENGYIALTPIQINRTDYSYMPLMQERIHAR